MLCLVLNDQQKFEKKKKQTNFVEVPQQFNLNIHSLL